MRKTAFWLMTLLVALCLSVASGVFAQSGVRVVVVNEFANVRLFPALGADVLGSVPGGWPFTGTARSPDNEWLQVDFNGNEGWVHLATMTVLQGDPFSLPVRDPRSIPFGGFESPRAGSSNTLGSVQARVVAGLRVRAGPSTAYPTLANMPLNGGVSLLGRTGDSAWVQVNFDGTLGWVAVQYLELLNGANLAQLPINGIVADSPPLSDRSDNTYVATLKLMLARVDLAQPSLDAIRGLWTDAALWGRAFCPEYPAQPSDMHISNPVLAAHYGVLNPLLSDFNDAMFNVRHAIKLFIQVCNQPGTGNPVGTATVQGALGTVNLADGQFVELRRRLAELIPPDLQPGPNECLFTFQGESEILPVVSIGTIVFGAFDVNDTAVGYCFDAIAGQSLRFETLQLPDSNIVHFMSVSPLDNPTDFIALGRGISGEDTLSLGPVQIPTTGRYLVVLSDIGADSRSEPPSGDFALLISDASTGTTTQLLVDPVTGLVSVGSVVDLSGGTGTGDLLSTPEPGESAVCPSTAFTCNQLFTCQEAIACLQAGNQSLDDDNDGIPCENILCSGG